MNKTRFLLSPDTMNYIEKISVTCSCGDGKKKSEYDHLNYLDSLNHFKS